MTSYGFQDPLRLRAEGPTKGTRFTCALCWIASVFRRLRGCSAARRRACRDFPKAAACPQNRGIGGGARPRLLRHVLPKEAAAGEEWETRGAEAAAVRTVGLSACRRAAVCPKNQENRRPAGCGLEGWETGGARFGGFMETGRLTECGLAGLWRLEGWRNVVWRAYEIGRRPAERGLADFKVIHRPAES